MSISEAAIGRAHGNELRRHLDDEEAAESASSEAYVNAQADFLGRVARGEDTRLPSRPFAGARQWKVSEMLDSSETARQILFAACREASNGRDAGLLLRQFVEQCARDYAEDHAERYL